MRKIVGMSYAIFRLAPVRKGIASINRFRRAGARWRLGRRAYLTHPPVLANSFPKSGTHLLDQVLAALPGIKDYGSFLASQPTIPFRPRSIQATLRHLHAIAPGELSRAHLWHHDDVARALEARSIAHFFIYRDPRNVVVSEAHYLAHMNRWHRLHKYFKALPTTEARVRLSIRGGEGRLPYDYPDVAARFARYAGWLSSPDVFAVRFEDLRGPSRDATVRAMVEYYIERSGSKSSVDDVLAAAIANINPGRSHTFREGGSGGWRKTFTPELKEDFKLVAGQLLIDLGYEKDMDW